MYTLTLPQIGRRIRVNDGQTILEAALDAGVPFPHSCRSGRCGACKSLLLEGQVAMGNHTAFALTADEKAEEQILACRAVPETDVTVAWLEGEDAVARHPVVRQAAEVVAIDDLTHDIRRIRLMLEDRAAFRFQAGQYVRVTMEGAPPRDYSLASLPEDRYLELHVRAVPGGRTSSRITQRLRVAEIVRIEGPFGSAFLREGHGGPIIAVAGGSGLAPIKSIVESALIADPKREVHIYFGARSPRDIYLEEHFRGLAMDLPNTFYHAVLSEAAAPGYRTGYVSDAIAGDHVSLAGAKVYAAGPPPMVEAVRSVVQVLGAKPDDIHADVFFTPEGNHAKILQEVQP
jgi:CDP-4-dehydro-6-deoxyglucose reductase/ferredoxin-NAD(P)+ reductase (naphthalene dioxygenase ferredoxin-specific)